jgi:hypothetical protein
MGNKQPREFRERVEPAADAALQTSGSVGPLELLLQMRLLTPSHFTSWQKGIIPTLEDVIQGGPKKLQQSFQCFQQWAQNRGMKPVKVPYLRSTPGGDIPLAIVGCEDL